MSIHKLTAGSGYDYLTRQVAAMDATDKGHTGLASYYTEKGETPGVWIGSGLTGLEGLDAGDIVTADHMQNLFGAGHHPLATERTKALDLRIGRPGPSPTEADYKSAARLGVPYPVYPDDVSTFRIEIAKRMAAVNEAAGLPGDWPVPAPERAKIRTEVATEMFRAEYGRDPADARELAATIAKHSRPKTTAVAGYDLTFSPVKSVSVLWAVADQHTAAVIERAHQAAVKDALDFIERDALYTRMGAQGVRQVDVRGLLATAFTHRDSRAGDPDLHTHVAVANKVEAIDPDGNPTGKWLAIDGRILFKATVSASETYNTALERHLVDALGVRFAERPNPDARKRPVREIVGVDHALNEQFSKRRASVEDRRRVLAAQFQATHGRPPTPIETIHLAQQATLETRDAKHEPRSLADQRAAWHNEAINRLAPTPSTQGRTRAEQRLAHMLATVLDPTPGPTLDPAGGHVPRPVRADAAWFNHTADQILTTLQEHRSTWQTWHVYAEAQRRIRATDVPTEQVDNAVQLLVDEVLNRSISLRRPTPTDSANATPTPDTNEPEPVETVGPVEPVEPADLRRVDGASVYTVAGADLYTSTRIIDAEQRLVAAAGRLDGHRVEATHVDLALLESTANGVSLNDGQATLVREMATSGARLQLAIAPAGSGKTTAMRALTKAWTEGGGHVIGLAPSAAAADALRTAISPTESHQPTQPNHPDNSADAAGPDGFQATRTNSRTATAVPATQTDTLAKLVHSLTDPAGRESAPAWVRGIGPGTLVVIDEAGMADTLSLDTAVAHVLAAGGSVRLIGDDQQLSAIGAGGVLRDIRSQHGALHLSELMRFRDPAEGAASLALREGKPEALGFYLDRDRIHVGDLATMTDDVFASWLADRSAGHDSIMLAPTRELVSELNQRARAHRLQQLRLQQHRLREGAGHEQCVGSADLLDGPTRGLSDGNQASAEDLIITRVNQRNLRASATDWVKNGDRWTVLDVHPNGDLTVQHTVHGRQVRLPSDYVDQATDLGYACTVHTAQGVTADTMHGIATGTESRQQLYTMLTRGAMANHVYLELVGDGDPHSVIHPTTAHPTTGTDILENILARDGSAHSVISQQAALEDPTVRLGGASERYLDALYVAAEQLAIDRGIDVGDAFDARVEALLPGLTDEPAWPALRAHLILLTTDTTDSTASTGDTGGEAAGESADDPLRRLSQVIAHGDLDTALDRAAVLDWRLDDSGHRGAGTGPLPWMPGIPHSLRAHETWGPYLAARATLVAHLAGEVRDRATTHARSGDVPEWADNDGLLPTPQTIVEVEVWRAATRVPDEDRRPTGRPQFQKATATHQRRLEKRLEVEATTGGHAPALAEWGHLLRSIAPQIADDDFTPLLARRLAAIARAGLPAHQLLRAAGDPAHPAGPLPDDHPAAALWWRMTQHLTPAVATNIDTHPHSSHRPGGGPAAGPGPGPGVSDSHRPAWFDHLVDVLGADLTEAAHASGWWPALVTNITHGLERGWTIPGLIGTPPDPGNFDGLDIGQALVWRTSVAMSPIPPDPDLDPNLRDDLYDAGYEQAPDDLFDDLAANHDGDAGDNSQPPHSLWDPPQRWPESLDEEPPYDPEYDTPPPGHDDHEDDPGSGANYPATPSTVDAPGGAGESPLDDEEKVAADLRVAALLRAAEAPPTTADPVTDEELRILVQHAAEWDHSPVTRERMLEINNLTQAYFETQFRNSWGRDYLSDRFGIDLAGDEQVRPGQAPPGWTHLVDHLRRRGVTDDEMLHTGVASRASTGRLIDRFRDRVTFPITHPQRPDEILGFVARRHPDLIDDDRKGPKYLNTPDTPLFHKGAQLYSPAPPATPAEPAAGAPVIPARAVLVEGPMDAIAVTLATAGMHTGYATLGTSLTPEQATQLSRSGDGSPIVATDPDLAGIVAAGRAFWLLSARGTDPERAALPGGTDPADLLHTQGPAALAAALHTSDPMSNTLLHQILNPLDRTATTPISEALAVVAAAHPDQWSAALNRITNATGVDQSTLERGLRDTVHEQKRDPHQTATARLRDTTGMRQRAEADPQLPAHLRWARLAEQADHRLPDQPDWKATANLLQQAHETGLNVPEVLSRLTADSLSSTPATDLRYRLVATYQLEWPPPPSTTSSTRRHQSRPNRWNLGDARQISSRTKKPPSPPTPEEDPPATGPDR